MPGDEDRWIEAKPAQYAADLRSEEVKDFLRKDLKPLLIKQPEGKRLDHLSAQLSLMGDRNQRRVVSG